jgi:tRNA (guanine-N7-)-methyltransferase
MSDEQTHRHGAFFGRRKGHPLRSRQAELFETLLPRLAVDLTSSVENLAALFPDAVDDIQLEIGFGGAEHLVGRAKANPRIGFIGAEPFVNGMAKALAAVDDAKLTNIRLHHADAVELLDWLPAGSLGRIDLLYPDPWPKRRHWKRRFVNEANVARLARVLRPGGEFRFATDWANYAEWTLARLTRASDLAWTAERADDWRKPWPDFTQTRYEAKAVREGRVPCYLGFRKIGPSR